MKEWVIITGASTGIGWDAAESLARAGYGVLPCVRKEADRARWAAAGVEALIFDVTDEAQAAAALARVRALAGAEDRVHLVNNAGIAVAGPVEGTPLARWHEQMEVNFFGLLRATQNFLPLVRGGRGRVINISSVSGRFVTPYLGPYCASKYAVEALSDALRRELRQFGVEVVLVEPAPVATPIWEKNLSQKDNVLRELRPGMEELYGAAIARFTDLVAQSAKEAVPVDRVSRVILHALRARRPRTRYLVGPRGISLQIALLEWLPDRWADALIAKGFGRS